MEGRAVFHWQQLQEVLQSSRPTLLLTSGEYCTVMMCVCTRIHRSCNTQTGALKGEINVLAVAVHCN